MTGEEDRHDLVKDETNGLYICTVCDAQFAHLGEHQWSEDWMYDDTRHWHNCTIEGCKARYIPYTGEHTFVDGKCSVCGYEKKQEEKPAETSYDYDNEYVAPAPLPPQTGDASYLAIGIGMIAAALCIALRKRQSN